jgi:hypothetical protein
LNPKIAVVIGTALARRLRPVQAGT